MAFLRSRLPALPSKSTSYVLSRRLQLAHSLPATGLVAFAVAVLVTLQTQPLRLPIPAWVLQAGAFLFFVQGFLYVRFIWRFRVTLSPGELRYDDGLRVRRIERTKIRRVVRGPGPRPQLRFFGKEGKKPLLVVPLLFEPDAAFTAFLDKLEKAESRSAAKEK